MSDEEVICEWMEPRRPWDGKWWILRGPKDDVASETNSKHYAILTPRVCDPLMLLGLLHEVEERLTEEQWERYAWLMMDPAGIRRTHCLLHATAAQKIAALAAVIRAEKESHAH